MSSKGVVLNSTSSDTDETRSFLENLISSSPPGEVNEIYKDLKVVLRDDELLLSVAESIFQKYNCDNSVVVQLTSIKEPFILSWYGLLPDGRVVEPRSRKVFEFNHFTKKASNFEFYIQDDKLEDLRLEFEFQLDKYVSSRYPMGVASVYSADNEIQMIITNSRFTPDKYINGSWCSTWQFNPKIGTIKGILKIRVHYYEDGNVQLKVSKSLETAVVISDQKTIKHRVKTVIDSILKSEDEFQNYAREKFDHLNNKGFKNLRKLLPITKTKINWDSIESYGAIGILNL